MGTPRSLSEDDGMVGADVLGFPVVRGVEELDGGTGGEISEVGVLDACWLRVLATVRDSRKDRLTRVLMSRESLN